MRNDFLVFGSPQIHQDEIDEVVATLESGWLGTGPKVAQLESDFANYKNIQECQVAAVNSGTAALHISMIASGVKPGDEVITTALTFCATVNAIIHAGATPVIADVDSVSMNIDPAAIEAQITDQTRAIIPVHFAGRACDMDTIIDIANQYDLKVIEDCAHAIETEYKGQKAGNFGDFGCYSFYVTKNVITGEGGMITARNKDDIGHAKILSLHGMTKDAWRRYSDEGHKHYKVVECGFKYNMMDIQAAIGMHQLKRVEENWLRRQEIWYQYQEAFADLPITVPAEPDPETRHAYHLYTILIDEEVCGIQRDFFLDAMTRRNIGVGVHYLSLPEHPYYQEHYGWRPTNYPNATKIGQQTVSLPLSAKLNYNDVVDVIETVKMLFN